MSGIFGIIDFDAKPIEPPWIEKMQNAIGHWGPDGVHTWHDPAVDNGSAALGLLLLYNTPEALYERLPRWDAETLVAFVAEARIDNRAQLCDQFQIPHPERSTIPDGDLIYRAYLRWGEQCSDHLLGDWSFAAWHPQLRKLILLRDPMGNTGLVYWQNGSRLAFASDPKALYAIGAPRRLNELHLAKILTSWSGHHKTETIFEDIRRIPPAHYLKATPQGTEIHQYWWLENVPDLQLPSVDQYIEGFLEVYERAVQARLRTHRPIATTLSGGLDSGSVTALAARALAAHGQGLTAFTAIPLHETTGLTHTRRFGDETEFASTTAQAYDNIEHVLLQTNHITPIQGVRNMLESNPEPGHAGSNYFWMVDVLQQTQARGCGTLLTGQGGNATISWTGAPHLRSFFAAVRHLGPVKAIRQSLPPAIQSRWMTFRMRGYNWENTSIHPDFARRLDLFQRRMADVEAGKNTSAIYTSPRENRYAIIRPGLSIVGDLWSRNGAWNQLEVRDPTFDKELIEFTIAIPDPLFDHPQGLDRNIIRTAMQGILPDKVRLNPRRGLQAADLVVRLRQSAQEVEATLDEVDRTPTNAYINVPHMRTIWQRIQSERNPEMTQRAITVLMRGLHAGLFLNGLEQTP